MRGHCEGEGSAYVLQWRRPGCMRRGFTCFMRCECVLRARALLTRQAHFSVWTGHSDQGRQDISRDCSLLRRQGAPHRVAMGVGALLRFDQRVVFIHCNAHDSRSCTMSTALLMYFAAPFIALLPTLRLHCTCVYRTLAYS